MGIPDGAPYFDAPGQWVKYQHWNLLVPCTGCGRRKIDNPTRYGLQPDLSWPDSWVTEDLCELCWLAQK